MTKAMWRETIREIPKMWKDAPYSYDGEFFRMPERKVFPKPHGPLHPAMWVAGGSPGTFTEAGELGLGVFCFSIGRPAATWSRCSRRYKTAIVNATPVGDYVNDNIMGVTNMLCMEDRTKAFETASNMGMNYYSTLAYHWLDNVPRPKHLPEWPEQDPRAHARAGRAALGRGLHRGRRPRRLRPLGAALGRHGLRPAHVQPHHQHAAHRGGRRVDGAVRPRGHPARSTPTPSTRRLATGARRRPSWPT